MIRRKKFPELQWRLPGGAKIALSALLLWSLVWLGAPAAGQQQEKKPSPPQSGETIRLSTQLVNVLFSATDKHHHFVRDLSQDEVTILEDGKPQQIFAFKREFDLPLTLAILVDVSGSERFMLPQLRAAGARFIGTVLHSSKDAAAIIQFDDEATVLQELTSDADRLRRALAEVRPEGRPMRGGYGGPLPPINGRPHQGGTSIYDSVIATCSDLLAKEVGRKTIIMITDGYDTTSNLKVADAVNEALRSEVVIYAIGIGMAGGQYGGMRGRGPRGRGPISGPRPFPQSSAVDEGALKKLCEPTGGRSYVPKGAEDLDQAFAQLEQELRQQYLLAYEPTKAADGTFRKIEIRVKRKDVHVYHRRGYYAPTAAGDAER